MFFAGCLLFMLSFLVCVVLFLDVFIHISSAQGRGFSFLCMYCDILSNIVKCRKRNPTPKSTKKKNSAVIYFDNFMVSTSDCDL